MIPCSECSLGQMHKTKVTYFTWLGEELITVPDFPAWVCDICGRREYDSAALNQLAILLNPISELPKKRKKVRISSKTKKKHTSTRPAKSE